jgi:Post-segregation antitoxin CcdA
MNEVARGPKRSVNTTLSENLVLKVRKLTGNLSKTVKQPLAEFVVTRPANNKKERRIDAAIAMLNDLHDRHGGLGD